MRDYYNPDEGCPAKNSQLSRHRYEPGSVLGILASLVTIYRGLSSSGQENLDDALRGISAQLAGLRAQLAEIQRDLKMIIDMLNELPQLIRGEVKDLMIESLLGEADQVVGIIQDEIRPEYISQYLDDLTSILNQLQSRMGSVLRLGGLSAVITVTPYFSAWLGGQVALQRARRETNPGWVIDSPWNRSFSTSMHSLFLQFFKQAEKQDSDFEALLKSFPDHRWSFRLLEGRFVKDQWRGNFRLTCRDYFGQQEKLQQRIVPGKWLDVDLNDPANAVLASAFKLFLKERSGLCSFYSTIPNIYKKKNEYLGTFIEPPNIWGPTRRRVARGKLHPNPRFHLPK